MSTSKTTWSGRLLEWFVIGGGATALLLVFGGVVFIAWVAGPSLPADNDSASEPVKGGEFCPRIEQGPGMPPRWLIRLTTSKGDEFSYTVATTVKDRIQKICDQGWPNPDAVVTWLVSLDASGDAYIGTQEALGADRAREQVLKALAAESAPVAATNGGGTSSPSAPSPQQPTTPRSAPAQPVTPAPTPTPAPAPERLEPVMTPPAPVEPTPPPVPTLRDLIKLEEVNYWMLFDHGTYYVLEIYTMTGAVGYRYRDRAAADADVRWLQESLSGGR